MDVAVIALPRIASGPAGLTASCQSIKMWMRIKKAHKLYLDCAVETSRSGIGTSWGPPGPSAEAIRRLLDDYQAIHADNKASYLSICPLVLYTSEVGDFELTKDPSNALACINGPDGTPYAGGIFWVHMYFPISFPEWPVKVRFLTPVYHPKVKKKFEPCLTILTPAGWSREFTAQSVLEALFLMLANPGADDGSDFESKVAKEYDHDRDGFMRKAKCWTKKHAMCMEINQELLVRDWLEHFKTHDIHVAACKNALINWRNNIWESGQKDVLKDIEEIIPDTAITTISINFRRLCSLGNNILELNLDEWDARNQYITDKSHSSLGKLLVKVWSDTQEAVDRAKEEEQRLQDEDEGVHAPSREVGQPRGNSGSYAESSETGLESNVPKGKETIEDLEKSEEAGTSPRLLCYSKN
ncbi:hypothetical protein EYC80_006239 [Monilinia laxa]|uniref:UBC core domain-containing protein n=1 Tax=Monilinia laxa TaxID=61186 RepID=A0A5N6KI56_MONLA|nr:hypothetical protein EYC80_006239 [Monilinia laxa]